MKKLIAYITKSWMGLILLLLLIIGLNSSVQNHFIRLDLTADKRYSLADVSKAYLKKIDKPVEVRVYLTGELNPGFERLKRAVEDMLSEFNVYSNNKLHFSFPEPGKIKDKATYDKLKKEIEDLGLAHINVIEEGKNGERKQKPVFPWAVIEANGRRYPVRLLVNIPGNSGEENLNSSIETLEYNLMDGLRIVSSSNIRKIAFLEGHNELPEDEVYDITEALSKYFQVDRGALGNTAGILDDYELLIVAHPKRTFSEQDKYILDQYLMQGGKLLWLADGVRISVDSLASSPQTVALRNELNVEDMLFTYGVRINSNLVQDLQCALYPVNYANPGEKPDFKPTPWYYSPLLFQAAAHPITRGLSPIKSEFCSTVDTISTTTLKKRTLLLTSGSSNVYQAPVPVDLNIVAASATSNNFKQQSQAIAVLVEGTFPSVFRNRNEPKGISNPKPPLKSSKSTAIIVIGDGDIIRNDVDGTGTPKRIYPLGYDRFTAQNLFSNRDFILNCVNYLTDDTGWMSLRSKKIALRLLSKKEANENRLNWQLINILLPLFLLFLMGILFLLLRKRRYAKPH